MKESIDEESRKALVTYRMERAKSTLAEVVILMDNSLYSTAVNRLYYSAYYAAIALLLNDGYSASTHAGVRSLLGLHYIKTGKISPEVGSNYMILFEKRHRSDYDDFIETSETEVKGLIPLATDFVNAIEKLL